MLFIWAWILELKFGAMLLGKFGQNQRVNFWVLVWLVKSVLMCSLEPLSTLVWLDVISLKFEWFWNVFGWKMFMENFEFFHECSSLFLTFLPRTKRFVFWFKVLIYFIKFMFYDFQMFKCIRFLFERCKRYWWVWKD